MNKKERERIIKIARLYYYDGYNYQAISKKLNLSSAYISKLLKIGREEGLIEIKIKDDIEDDQISVLSNELKDKFNLNKVFVKNSIETEDVNLLKANVAKDAAVFLYENVNDNSLMGITWGTTILNTIQELKAFKKKDINLSGIQLCGNLSSVPIEVNGINLVAEMCEIFNGQYKLLSVPAYVDNEYIRDAIMTDSSVKRIFDNYRNVNYSVSSVGSLSDLNYSTLYEIGYLNYEQVTELINKGAVGDILFYFYTLDGEIIEPDFSNRFIRIALEEYKRIPEKIVIAVGRYKVKAIYGAIKAGLINTLITDSDTARELIKFNY